MYFSTKTVPQQIQFCIKKFEITDALASEIIESINFKDIDTASATENDFFLSIELSLVHELLKRNLIKKRPTTEFIVDTFRNKDLDTIISEAMSRPQQLRQISKLTAPGGNTLPYSIANESLTKASAGPCRPEILKDPILPRQRIGDLDITAEEVRQICQSLNDKKSNGPCHFSAKILKKLSLKDVEILANRFNLSHARGIFGSASAKIGRTAKTIRQSSAHLHHGHIYESLRYLPKK